MQPPRRSIHPLRRDANTAVWGNGDDGNLNYDKGDLFTTHLKGSHELLLSFPDEWKFMGRVGWLYDFVADDTARTRSTATPSRRSASTCASTTCG